MSKKKLALVTGGAGFVGSHLCEKLVREGFSVISLDNYFTGSKDNHIEGVEYREGHTKDIEKHVPESPDIIYHLGEYSRVHQSLEEPEIVWDLNIIGTIGVLEYWRKRGCKLVYAGSSTKFTSKEENVTGGEGRDLAPYTWAKAANSELVANYGAWYELPYAIAYFYNVYGPRERSFEKHGTVVETFRSQVERGEVCTVRKPGTQTRAFTHVIDTVDALFLVGEKGEGDEYGVCAGDVKSLLDIVDMLGGKVEMLPQTKISRSVGAIDSSKVRALGWEPKHSLKKYLSKE